MPSTRRRTRSKTDFKSLFRRLPLRLELLEDRTVPSTGQTLSEAIGLVFDGSSSLQTVRASGYLADANGAMHYRIHLEAGDVVTARVSTTPYGGGLNSFLRVFQTSGITSQIAANDNVAGLDAGVTFQASVTSDYDIAVSSFDNFDYDPTVALNGTGSSRGLFDLSLTKSFASIAPDLTVASFEVSEDAAELGESLTVHYRLENRGGGTSASTTFSLLASASSRFDDGPSVLDSVTVPALASGESHSGTFQIAFGTTLPPDAGTSYLGLQTDALLPSAGVQGNDWARVRLLSTTSVPPVGSNATLGTAATTEINSRVNAVGIDDNAPDFYQIVLTESGRFQASLDVDGSPLSLTLYDAQGRPIVRSDGRSADDPQPAIDHALRGDPSGTTYYLKVAPAQAGSSTYSLTMLFNPSISSLHTVDVAAGVAAMVHGDFNGDGIVDLATGNWDNTVTIFDGLGDGTFQRGNAINVDIGAEGLATGDFNGDGRLDLAAIGSGTYGLVILSGNGDGSFQDPLPLESHGTALAVGDFNSDGQSDLVVADAITGAISVFLGNSDGSFQTAFEYAQTSGSAALALGDFNADGHLDIAAAAHDVTILLGHGDGDFHIHSEFAIGGVISALAAGDFNGDGRLDLAVADQTTDLLTVLSGDGTGVFQFAASTHLGDQSVLITADFNGDGALDVAAASFFSNDVTILLGQGDGTFASPRKHVVGTRPRSLIAADLNGDGRPDLVSGNYGTKNATVLLNIGGGVFPQVTSPNSTGQTPLAAERADLNGDGRTDLVVVNRGSNDVTVLLGEGDGTFQSAGSFPAGNFPTALTIADFNGDGRPDLAIADYGSPYSSGVSILLGLGNGAFHEADFEPADGIVFDLAAGDFNRDGKTDLAYVLKYNSDFTGASTGVVLLGDGHGGFAPGDSFETGYQPVAIVAADLDGDNRLDLAVANYGSLDVTVFHGDGQGHFQAADPIALTGTPFALEAGDVNGDGRIDLAVATFNSEIVILLNHNGSFTADFTVPIETFISSMTLDDVTGDGRADLITADVYTAEFNLANTVTIFAGEGDGSFQKLAILPAGSFPFAPVVADFNGDTLPDLSVVASQDSQITVLLGTGAGTFVSPVQAPSPIQSTPLVANFTGGPGLDAVVLTQNGQILFRRGLANLPGSFAPPVVLNPSPAAAARDLAVVASTGGAPLLAALNARTFVVSSDRVPRVTIYRPSASGEFSVMTTLDLPSGFLPSEIASADLNGDGLGDLVITAAASDQVFVSLQKVSGGFTVAASYSVGVNPSAISLEDLNGDGARDIAVADRFSGQVSILHNTGNGLFHPEERYNAGKGLHGHAVVNEAFAVQSGLGSSALVANPTSGGIVNLIVLNSSQQSFSRLKGNGGGGYLNPSDPVVVQGGTPTAMAAGDLNRDGILDLAILSREGGTVSIALGNSGGGFTHLALIDVGLRPTGLNLVDVTRPGGGAADGILDLLVGNSYGDMLILPGFGDGTFGDYRRADPNVSLTVASAASGGNTFYFSNHGSDRLAFRSAASGTVTVAGDVYSNREQGIVAPGPQTVVNVQGKQYLLVVNSGANTLLVYTLSADGRPIAGSVQTYFTGTDPASLTVSNALNDLNGDEIPDVVIANRGSNDVSIFLGDITGGAWNLTYRPRQSSGGIGPTSVQISDMTDSRGVAANDGIPDLVVANGDSRNVRVLAGLEGGFYSTQNFAPPVQTSGPSTILIVKPVGSSAPALLAVDRVGGTLTLISNFLSAPVSIVQLFPNGSLPVVAAVPSSSGLGISQILLSNAAEGTLSLLTVNVSGFEVEQTWDQTTFPYVSDLAVVGHSGSFDVYGTDSGSEIAMLLATFSPSTPLVPPPAANPDSFIPSLPGFPNPPEVASNPDSLLSFYGLQTNAGDRAALLAGTADSASLGMYSDGGMAESWFDSFIAADSTPVGVHEEPDDDKDDPDAEENRPTTAWGDGPEILLNNLLDLLPAQNPKAEDPAIPEVEEKEPKELMPLLEKLMSQRPESVEESRQERTITPGRAASTAEPEVADGLPHEVHGQEGEESTSLDLQFDTLPRFETWSAWATSLVLLHGLPKSLTKSRRLLISLWELLASHPRRKAQRPAPTNE